MIINKCLWITIVFSCFYTTAVGIRCFIQQIENGSSLQINLAQTTKEGTDRLLSVDAFSTMALPPEDVIVLPYSISKYMRKTVQLKHLVIDDGNAIEIAYDLYYAVKFIDDKVSLIIVYLNSDRLEIEIPFSQLFGTERIAMLNIPLKLTINNTLKFKLEHLNTVPSTTGDKAGTPMPNGHQGDDTVADS